MDTPFNLGSGKIKPFETVALSAQDNPTITLTKDYALIIAKRHVSIYSGGLSPAIYCTGGELLFSEEAGYPSNYEVQRVSIYRDVKSGSVITFDANNGNQRRTWVIGSPK